MSDLRADSPAPGLAGPTQAPPGREPPGKGWPLSRWLILVALVFAAARRVALHVRRAETDCPARRDGCSRHLKLADGSDELLALNDPTLFALPHAGDFVTAIWSQAPVVNRPSFRWTEAPRWLPLPADELMTVFTRFMQTNYFAGFALRIKTAGQTQRAGTARRTGARPKFHDARRR